MPIDFSIIIPTFRRPREVVEALRSVLGQRDVSVEVFVIDDCPDGSAQEAVYCVDDDRVRYFKNPNPTGGVPSIVRNIGWPLATGTFVHFLDDDDVVVDGHYASVKAVFEEHPSIGLVFGRINPVGNGPSDQLKRENEYFSDAARRSAICRRLRSRFPYVANMLFNNALLVCSSSVIRRECVAQIGGFDPRIRLMEDADYHVRAMRTCNVMFMDRPAISYRVGNPSLMHSPVRTEDQTRKELAGRRQMQASYKKTYGALEFYALGLLCRLVLNRF